MTIPGLRLVRGVAGGGVWKRSPEQGPVEAGKRGPDGVVRNHLSSGKSDHIMAGPIIVGRASMVKQADAAVAANMG